MKAVVLSLLCLTVFAGSASAECAWVLWSPSSTPDQRFSDADWSSGGSGGEVYPTYTDGWTRITRITGEPREGSLGDWIDWLRSTGPYNPKRKQMSDKDFVGSFRMPGLVVTKTETTTVEWKCLPDTIDPRGPKGK